nr:WD-40 repeat-containing protein MSI4-like [Tanacetum cinerariifolium]
MGTKGVVAAAVVTAVVVARGGKWRRGSGRSEQEEPFWFRRKKPARKVFRRRHGGGGGGRPAVAAAGGESISEVEKQLDGVTSPVNKFVEPKPVVVCVQWCPDKSSVLGSSAEDGGVNIIDYEIMNKYYNLNLDVFWC